MEWIFFLKFRFKQYAFFGFCFELQIFGSVSQLVNLAGSKLTVHCFVFIYFFRETVAAHHSGITSIG